MFEKTDLILYVVKNFLLSKHDSYQIFLNKPLRKKETTQNNPPRKKTLGD